MKDSFKKYNIFLFIATFARAMVESFIPIVLYKNGFSLEEILFYYVFMLFFCVLVVPLLTIVTNNIKHKYVLFISIIAFIIMNILLTNPLHTNGYLILLGFYYAVYRKSFWIVRRYYNITCTTKKSSGKLSGFVIANVYLAGVLASLIGGYLIDINLQKYSILIASTLLATSIIPLLKLKNDTKTNVTTKDVIDIFKKMPKKNILHLSTYEGYYFLNALCPLYMFMYVKENCSFVGIFNLILNASSVAFILLFSKKIDKDKHDYLSLVTLVLTIIYIGKINTTNGILMIIIGILEGYFLKLHNVSYTRNTSYDGKNYKEAAYNVVLEMIMNTTRFGLLVIYLLLGLSFKQILLVSTLIFGTMALFKFDDGKGGYN